MTRADIEWRIEENAGIHGEKLVRHRIYHVSTGELVQEIIVLPMPAFMFDNLKQKNVIVVPKHSELFGKSENSVWMVSSGRYLDGIMVKNAKDMESAYLAVVQYVGDPDVLITKCVIRG